MGLVHIGAGVYMMRRFSIDPVIQRGLTIPPALDQASITLSNTFNGFVSVSVYKTILILRICSPQMIDRISIPKHIKQYCT